MKTNCARCNKEFTFSPSQERKYCSRKCYFASNKKSKNGNWKGGIVHDPWYFRWIMIKQRCLNPRNKDYPRYGGRGIKLLLTYRQLGILWNRHKASTMKQQTIDRIDNDGNYCFRNCRFVENSYNSKRSAILKRRGQVI